MMEITDKRKQFFTQKLMEWHDRHNERSLPWKQEKDPYKIWLSEIILQQTRAEQGLPYYLSFTERYPTVLALADAKDEDVFRLWQGLGYYNRCKNLLYTARVIRDEYNGVFPDAHEVIINLKGIGSYTAAAIASFAYGLPHAVVDGNVYRVLSRFFGIDMPYDTTMGKRLFASLAEDVLYKADPAGYNQGIMDYGAVVCKPSNPICGDCLLATNCIAKRDGLTNLLPVKSKRVTVKKRFFHYFVVRCHDEIWINKRAENDIWQNLHEPFLIETEGLELDEGKANQMLVEAFEIKEKFKECEYSLTQRLTHQIIYGKFYSIDISQKPLQIRLSGEWMFVHDIKKIAFPKLVTSFFEKSDYFYNLH